MSGQLTLLNQSESLVLAQEEAFEGLSASHKAVSFKREASFAVQILKTSEYVLKAAASNPESLKNAILNVASVGLSLNPVLKLAYLVPRNGSVCLDPSYLGLLKLATDCGAIMWAAADLVYEKDDYVFNGHGREVTHKFNPFSKDRGELVGAYCMAKDHNGEYHVAQMSIEDIYKIRNRSEAYKRKYGPWITDESEMIKKTLVRRGSKMWPKTNTKDDRFEKAITVFDETEGVDMSPVPIAAPMDSVEPKEGVSGEPTVADNIRELIAVKGRDEAKFVEYLGKTFKRKIETLEELSAFEATRAISILNNLPSPDAKTVEATIEE